MSKEIEEKISQEEIKYHIGLVDDFIKLAKRRIATCKIVMAFHFVAILCYVFTRNLNSVATLFDVIQVSILIILTNYSFDNFLKSIKYDNESLNEFKKKRENLESFLEESN